MPYVTTYKQMIAMMGRKENSPVRLNLFMNESHLVLVIASEDADLDFSGLSAADIKHYSKTI